MSLGTILTGILDACQVLSPARSDEKVQDMTGDEPLARRADGGDEPLARRADGSDEPLARRADGGDEPLGAAHSATPAGRRSRGDRQREAIVTAVRELLEQRSFEELSVSAISKRAGITRSGFYFYFESKYDVLALIFDEATHELEELTHYFAPRAADETPAEFATRMVGSAAAVYAHHDPIMIACNNARNTDAKIREILDRQVDTVIEQIIKIVDDEIAAGTARPISDDIPALVRTLGVTTALLLSGDASFIGPDGDLQRGVRVLEQLWLASLWGGPAGG